jgi:hypothetical protein
MIKRKYDRFNGRCYILIKCDFCGFQPVYIDGYGIKSKEIFSEFEKTGWKRLGDGRIICTSCDEDRQDN